MREYFCPLSRWRAALGVDLRSGDIHWLSCLLVCYLHAFSHGPSADEARCRTDAYVDILHRSRLGREMKSLAGSRLGLLGEEKDAFKRGSSALARAEPSASSNWRANLLFGPRGVSLRSNFSRRAQQVGKIDF